MPGNDLLYGGPCASALGGDIVFDRSARQAAAVNGKLTECDDFSDWAARRAATTVQAGFAEQETTVLMREAGRFCPTFA